MTTLNLGGSSLGELGQLLKLMDDPTAYKQRMTDLTAAEGAAMDAVAAAQQSQAELASLKTEVETRAAQLATERAHHNIRAADVEGRIASHHEAKRQWEAKVAAVEAHHALVIANLAQRDQEVAARERAAAAKEKSLAGKLAATDDLQARLDAKLRKLNEALVA